jgi:transmembrane sensor
VRFTDGSALLLEKGALVEVLENTGDRFVTALRNGGCTFDVRPGGPRRWVVESGHVRVEVVGTKFRVQRFAGLVRIQVEHGVVVVHGDRVADGVQRLTAGAALDVVDDGTAAIAVSSSSAWSATPPPPSSSAGAAPSGSASSAPSGTDVVGVLLKEAEAAETRGDVDGAIARLRVIVATAKGARYAIASFSLARLLLPTHPNDAAAILRVALERGMPAALEEHARARLVEAYGKSGSRAAASQAAIDYLERYPKGAHRDEVARWQTAR